MSNANALAPTTEATDDVPTWYDKCPPTVQAVLDAEERAHDAEWAEGDAHFQRLEKFGFAAADAVLKLGDVQRHPNASAAVVEKARERVAATQKRKADYLTQRKAEQATKPGNKYKIASERAQELLRRGKRLKPFGMTAELTEGETIPERTAKLVAAFRDKRAEKKAVVSAPLTADEITEAIADGVDRGTDIAAAARRVTRGDWHADRNGGHYEARRLEFPTVNIPNGVGGLSRIIDGGAFLTLFAAEIKTKLNALALEGHNPSQAIPMAERLKRLAEIDAESLMIQREHEFWVRQARETGENPGPRISEDIRAILDIH